VNVEAVYPNEKEEYSFEELRARSRGWGGREWREKKSSTFLKEASVNAQRSPRRQYKSSASVDVENLTQELQAKVNLNVDESQDTSQPSLNAKPQKQKRLKIREVKQETQTVKTRLESPTGKGKLRRKNSNSVEPTMTFHSKAATNEIYELFNQPNEKNLDDTQSGDDTDDGYSTAGESTGTGRISGNTTSEFDDTLASMRSGQEISSQPDSVSPWSDFTASKHLPRPQHKDRQTSEDLTENMDSSQNQTQTTSASGFDTLAIAAIANQDFGDFDTKVIAAMAGDFHDGGCETETKVEVEELKTPIDEPEPEPAPQQLEVQNKPRYVPLPPEDYEPTPLRPFRDPDQAHQSRLPFMTPIVEKTESSLGANTGFRREETEDEYRDKTPSRRGAGVVEGKFESPSKLKLERFLISSPQQMSPSPKRKLDEHEHVHECAGAEEIERVTSSPRKKKLLVSPDGLEEQLPPTTSLETTSIAPPVFKASALPAKVKAPLAASKGPVIQDAQCNPVDASIRRQILASVDLTAYAGYHDHGEEQSQNHTMLKKYADRVANAKIKSSPRKQDKTTGAICPILNFAGTHRVYAVKRLLGKGAFAPVYLVESYDNSPSSSEDSGTDTLSHRSSLEAIKTDSPPLNSSWEFHILRLLADRLSQTSSSYSHALHSILIAHEVHVFADEAYLILDFHAQGTLLDLVNWTREERVKGGKPAGEGLEEVLAMYFSVQLLRVVDSVHGVGILHGDLKGDNCLVRLESGDLSDAYAAGAQEKEWARKGLTLIDFGRGVDVHAFVPGVQFIADWDADSHDCAEIREKRPWVWQLDYFGVAGVVHTLLFGKDIHTEVVSQGGLGAKKEWRIKEGLRRYWQQELWGELFHCLVNSALVSRETGEEGGRISGRLSEVKGRMERWLEMEGERRDLRGCIRRAERLIAEKTRGRK
jgi:checkpoint serine/threonine-protein kinase